jgi:hypothetical protein
MPNLQSLDLCKAFGIEDSDAVGGNSSDKPLLQHLKHLGLTHESVFIPGFLCRLSIPPLCEVIIDVAGYQLMRAEDCLPILVWANNRFRPPMLNSSIAPDTHYWRSLRIFHHESSLCFTTSGYYPEQNRIPFQLRVWQTRYPDGDEYLPRVLFPLLTISRIVDLEICCDDGFATLSKSMWIEIFGSISTLESICIVEARSSPFFEALSQDQVELIFPVLSSVIVRDEYPGPDYDIVLRSLRYRSQLGVPLKTLVIEDCAEVPAPVESQLQKVVEQVKVINSQESELPSG